MLCFQQNNLDFLFQWYGFFPSVPTQNSKSTNIPNNLHCHSQVSFQLLFLVGPKSRSPNRGLKVAWVQLRLMRVIFKHCVLCIFWVESREAERPQTGVNRNFGAAGRGQRPKPPMLRSLTSPASASSLFDRCLFVPTRCSFRPNKSNSNKNIWRWLKKRPATSNQSLTSKLPIHYEPLPQLHLYVTILVFDQNLIHLDLILHHSSQPKIVQIRLAFTQL